MATTASAVSSSADRAVHKAGPWLEKLARLGFAAKALLYMTIGTLAAAAALGQGGKAGTDSRGALQTLMQQQFGRVLVGVIGAGLIGYGLYRLIDAAKNLEDHGDGAKGIAKRIGSAVRGLIHLGLAYSAVWLALGRHQSGGGQDQQSQHWTARALETPGGKYAVLAVAACFLGYGLYQVFRAIKAKLNKQLVLDRMSYRAEKAVVAVSRFGMAARGIVFGMVGVLIGRAALDENPSEAGGIGKSLRELFEFGKVPFIAIAVGLIAYGIYQLVNAKYRRLNVG